MGHRKATGAYMDAEEYIQKHWVKDLIWRHIAGRRRHHRRLKRCADLMTGSTFADVGCACGHSTAELAKFHPGNWTGIDFSRTAIERAMMEFGDRFNFTYCGSIERLAGMYDGVVCSEVIEHVRDPAALVEALKAMTLGTLVVTTPVEVVSDPGHVRVFTEESLAAAFPLAKITREGPYWFAVWQRMEAFKR